MCSRRTSRPDFLSEEDQRSSDEAGTTQDPETIESAQQRGLLLNDVCQLRLGMHSGVGDRETASDKIAAQGAERLLVLLLQRDGVRNQHRLVVLRSPCEKRGDEGDAHASPLIPEQIGDARCFVVFVLGQIGVGELGYRHKERRDAEALKRSEESDVLVVGREIDAGVLPHGDSEDQITDEDHRLDANFG